MNLEDLLDCLRRDVLHDRTDRIAGDEDQLWSDTTLIRYIDQAQRRFARRSLCIRDGTSPVTRVQTVPYQKDYPLDPSIITIASARNLGNGVWQAGVFSPGYYDAGVNPILETIASPAVPGRAPAFVPYPTGTIALRPDAMDLGRGGHTLIDQRSPHDSMYFDVNDLSTMNPGKPRAFTTDEFGVDDATGSAGVVVMRLYPVPDERFAPTTIGIRVARMPRRRLSPQDMQASPEIPEDYHLDMLDYAAYLALRIVDHDAGDPQRAAEFQQAFDRHVEEAKLEIERKQFAPQPWQFGGNGFSYTGN